MGNRINRLKSYFIDCGVRSKISVALILLTVVPASIIYYKSLQYYKEDMVKASSENIYAVVKANNSVIESRINRIEDVSLLMISNKPYYEAFQKGQHYKVSERLKMARHIEIEMQRQFSIVDDIYDYYLFTPEWVYGSNNRIHANQEQMQISGLVEKANMAGGLPIWITGIDYGKLIQSDYLQSKKNYAHQYPFIMLRKMQFQYLDDSGWKVLDKEKCPILFVYITEEKIRSIYQSSVKVPGTYYAMMNADGTIISSANKFFQIGKTGGETLQDLNGKSGYGKYRWDEKEYIVCYDTIQDKEWFSFCIIPQEEIMKTIESQIKKMQFFTVIILLIIGCIIAMWLSLSISKPVEMLTKAAKKIATGDFNAEIPVPKGKDFRLMAQSFSHMEKEIVRLLEEKHEIMMKEKDTQIMVLLMQINPHFLYNTLNTINMFAIENGDDAVSEMVVSLSKMLHYTFKNTDKKITFSDEVGWAENYIYIMSKRFEGLFSTVWNIAPETLECLVPRFLLQPFLENVIIHGFKGKKIGGILKIQSELNDEYLQIAIEDNGTGMRKEMIGEVLYKEENSEGGENRGIGIVNIHQRLKLIYGEQYTIEVHTEIGKGTIFIIKFPAQEIGSKKD